VEVVGELDVVVVVEEVEEWEVDVEADAEVDEVDVSLVVVLVVDSVLDPVVEEDFVLVVVDVVVDVPVVEVPCRVTVIERGSLTATGEAEFPATKISTPIW